MPDAGRLVVGLDARPALFGRTGFGRTTRETIAALRRRDDVDPRLLGAAWTRARADCRLDGVVAPRLPARLQRLLAPLGFSVETLLGRLDVFHHTDLVFAPVRRAPQTLTVYDLVYLAGRDWHAPDFARDVYPRVAAAAARAAAVVVPCARVADEVLARGLAPAARLHVAPLGVDHVDPAPRADDRARVDDALLRCGLPPLDDDELLVLVPGTREPRKNQRAVLEAFLAREARGARPRARLVFAGPRGWGVPELERLLADPRVAGRPAPDGARAARPEVAPRVAALGEVDERDLGALLRRADVVAYCSFAEGFGLPALEALRCGRAVLSSRRTPMADLGGDALLAVEAEDPAAVSAGLERLLAEPALRAGLAAAGPARVAALTWDSHAAGLCRVWRSVVS